MKNKKFSQWLRRLPVLLLALILAVMPLVMAAPAYANQPYGNSEVLEGYTNYYAQVPYNGFLFDVPLPIKPNSEQYNTLAFAYTDAGYMVYFCTNEERPIYDPSNSSLKLDELLANVDVAVFNLSPDGQLVMTEPWERKWLNSIYDIDAVAWIGLDPQLSLSFSFEVQWSVVKAGGILNVFTGVGTWLSRAVQNISTMFWTAESGMTVLGYLAVASLALAVILLIFYLIAGWLKFH